MRYYVVDAFADALFQGNPAGVCLLDRPLETDAMQRIAAENNLAETAFVAPNGADFDLRWFTPKVEIDLCGHATLASAYVVSRFVQPDLATVRFHTQSGLLSVTKRDGFFELDFPARPPVGAEITPLMRRAAGCTVLEAHRSRDLLLLAEDEKTVRNLQPDMEAIRQIPDCAAVIITAKGIEADFVSRFFAPNLGVPEDPVTGSAHSTLIPFWAERLGKTRMSARQLSERGGSLACEHCGSRVKIAGKAVLYLSGEIFV